MNAGRELDALIAEKVTGWPYSLCRFHGTGMSENRRGTISEFCIKCGDPYGYHHAWPAYSTSIAAAWQVMEKLFSNGLVVIVSGKSGRPYECQIDTQQKILKEYADTAPLAICLASLAVVRGETT